MPLKGRFHSSLSRNAAPLSLAGLGVTVGIIASLVVNLFRFVIEGAFPFFGNGLHFDNFEALPPYLHFAFPVGACVLIGLILHALTPQVRRMGVAYVIDQVHNFSGHMPLRNAVLQFVTGALALLGGGSCGREGPAIHLGASSASTLGYWLHLPNNSIRTLIACGSAAAIAASFNTPVAGVIFAMEVIMMEYAIAGFIPVIIASVSGAVVTQIFYGDEPVFVIEAVSMTSLWEIPFVAFMGLVIGLLASIFTRIHRHALEFPVTDIRLRLLLVGIVTGTLALFIPEIMGMGYDSLNDALQANQTVRFLVLLLAAKLLVTAFSLGLGLPGGVIGPSLMLGGIAGAIMGQLGTGLVAELQSTPAFYALIGMCAMMGAVLQAPLAALMALLELSDNPDIILPAMIIIVVANLAASEVFGSRSVFLGSLQHEGRSFSKSLSRLLHRFGVSSIVKRNFAVVSPDTEVEQIRKILAANPEWIIIDNGQNFKSLVRKNAIDISVDAGSFNLDDVAGQQAIAPVSEHATLQEALKALQESETHYGYVYSRGPAGEALITGIISIDDIIAFYREQ